MAKHSCAECGRAVSYRANFCPHCGAEDPVETTDDFIWGFFVFMAIIIAATIVLYVGVLFVMVVPFGLAVYYGYKYYKKKKG